VPKPFPREFREDVVRVARNRDSKTTIEQVAQGFGIHATTLTNWLRKADVEAGARPGVTESSALRRLARRSG
jgi:transposase